MEIRYRIMLMEESGFFYKPDFDYNSINISDVAYQFSHTISAITNNEQSKFTKAFLGAKTVEVSETTKSFREIMCDGIRKQVREVGCRTCF
ncbi:MAG: hypothetical protein IJV20_10710 [Prevotella sp.]|nr:hypothetical protein [Prevotella sp.]